MAWWKRTKREVFERVHVAYVKNKDEFPPFYAAICECDWSGEQWPAGPGAEEAAFADAHAHAAMHAEIMPIEVITEVAYPMDRP